MIDTFGPKKKFTLNAPTLGGFGSSMKDQNILNPTAGPEPTREDIEYFKSHRKDILEPPLFSQSKRTGTVLHGAQSRNIVISEHLGEDVAQQKGLLKPTYDYDVWSKNPQKSAMEIEKKIDKTLGKDMAYIKVEVMGKSPGTVGKKKDFQRFTVMAKATPPTRQEVDYATFPLKSERPYEVIKVGGVKHEDIQSAYNRAHEIKYNPKRYFKTFDDIRRMRTYQKLMGDEK